MADTNYFDPAAGEPVPNDSRSSDASKSGVRQAWDAFSSRPENNAALIQFGLAMMTPQPKGQTFLGSTANAIGQAGEAATGNIAAQEAEAERASKQAERESTAGFRDASAQAALKNADAYSRQVDALGGKAGVDRYGLQAQRAFNTWLNKPIDTLGLTADPMLEAIKKKFPEVKTKDDIINNPALARRVLELFKGNLEGGEGTTEPSPAPVGGPPPSTTPPVPGAKFYQGHWYTRGPKGEAVQVPGF